MEKNFLLCWSESESHSVMSNSLLPHRLYSPWNSPGQNTGVDTLSLLQGIFPTQESNRGLLNCRRILYQLSCEGSPRKMVPKNLFAGQKWRKRQRMELWTWGEGRRGWQIWRESNTETYITMCKIDGQRESAVCLGELKQGLCISLEGRGGEGGSKSHVYLWLIHVEVWQKTTNSVKQLSFN